MANLHLNFRSDMLMRSVYPRVFLPDYNDWNPRRIARCTFCTDIPAGRWRRPRLPTSLCTPRCMASPL